MSEGAAIHVYSVPNDPNNDLAREKIQRLGEVPVIHVVCPPSVRELFRVPFVKDEFGGRHFGIEGIEEFVTRRLQTHGSV